MHYKGGSKPRKLPKTLTKEEVERLLARPNLSAPTGLRNRCLLELMYRAGLRVSEACGLHIRDVRLGGAEAHVHVRPEIAKGGREAYLPLHPTVEDLIERWKVVRRKYAAGKLQLFTTLQGGPVSRHYCYQMVKRYARRAGLEQNVHPHVLRHSFATHLLQDGFNLREVQQLLRHSNIQTTSVYLHVWDIDLQKKVRGWGAPAGDEAS